MKILLTGASGFIGQKLLKSLLKEDSVEVIALSSQILNNVKYIPSLDYTFDSEYLLKNGCEQVDTILHLGAWIPKKTDELNNIYASSNNIFSTLNLLNSNLPNLKRVIFISTVDVYELNSLTNETTHTVPQTMYGWSKLYCEQLIQNFCMNRSHTYQILRLGHVYGEGEEIFKKVMPVMIQNAISKKELTVFGNGMAKRTFIYIDDVVQAIINSLNLKQSEIINIVGNESITVKGLAELICSISGENISINYINSDIPNQDCLFDNSKMRQLLLSQLTPLKRGLEKEYRYMEGLLKK